MQRVTGLCSPLMVPSLLGVCWLRSAAHWPPALRTLPQRQQQGLFPWGQAWVGRGSHLPASLSDGLKDPLEE